MEGKGETSDTKLSKEKGQRWGGTSNDRYPQDVD